MKNIILATIALGIMSCTSQKKLETNNIPFEIGQSSVQNWSGGREESGSGAELKIIISEVLEGMSFEKVYFRGLALNCELKKEEGLPTIVASFKRDELTNTNVDKDGEEIQKTFELQPNQAILAYKRAGEKTKFTKIDNIKEKPPVLYKGRPRN